MEPLATWGGEVGNALHIVSLTAGVMLAFAGRYAGDALVYAAGSLAGAVAGVALAGVVPVAPGGGVFLDLLAATLFAVAGGVTGAALAWRAYPAAFYVTGTALAYLALTALVGVGPAAALPGIVVALAGVARLVALVALLGFLAGGLGLLVLVWGVAAATNSSWLFRLFERAGWAEELGLGRVDARAVTVVPPVALAALGLVAVAVQAGVWAYAPTRRIVVRGLVDLSVLLPDVGAYLVVFTGSVLAGAFGWWFRRVALAVYMAAIGAALVSVAPVTPEFLLALAALRLSEALGLVDSLSVLFLAVFLAGTATQLGTDAVE